MTGVVLGSGLGAFADTIEDRIETPYSEIPGWPCSTVDGHAGKLIYGRIGKTEVIALAGRAHLYEGYTAAQVAFGIRELARRGVRSLILTNAAGAINLDFQPGDLVLISDHINLMGANPLTGLNDDLLGPRFPDMTKAYSLEYREIAKSAAAEQGIHLPKAFTRRFLGRATRRRRRFARCGLSARIWWGCQRSRRRSPPIT